MSIVMVQICYNKGENFRIDKPQVRVLAITRIS